MPVRRPGVRSPALALALLAPVWVLGSAGRPAATPPARPASAGLVTGQGAIAPVLLRVPRVPPRASRAARREPPVFVAPDGSRVGVERIRRFLAARGSPMAPYAEAIVRAGIGSGVDPRVMVAIAGVESTFGLYRRGYNAWGWDVAYVRYSSWPDAISRYAAALALSYPGMRSGDFASGAARYTPPDPSTWAARCAAYFNAI